MGDILDELLLRDNYLLYLSEHVIERFRQLSDLVFRFRCGYAQAHVFRCDLPCSIDHFFEGFQRYTCQELACK
jgi:hypothetical protein